MKFTEYKHRTVTNGIEVLRKEIKWIYSSLVFKLSLTTIIILLAVNLRYTITNLKIKALNFLISS